jgi:hypothetical protein
VGSPGRQRAAAAAVVAVLLIGASIGVWLLVRGDDSGKAPRRAAARAASIRELDVLSSSIRHPVYWAGPRPRFTYELTRTSDGRIYVRYLPPGVSPGDPKASYLSVGTYPQQHAFATLRATAKAQKVSTIPLAGGGLAFQDRNRPTSVYVAYPGSAYQVEVFDPSASRARELVASGQIKQVGTPPRTATGPSAASVQDLRALEAELGHPIYWAGRKPNATYELTRATDGSVWVRYLPAGVHLGDRRPDFLTVGTYPQRSPVATLKATAARNGAVTMRVDKGGLAFVDRNHPTSVYVAYPKQDVQIEVFDPKPGLARLLVHSGRIGAVR